MAKVLVSITITLMRQESVEATYQKVVIIVQQHVCVPSTSMLRDIYGYNVIIFDSKNIDASIVQFFKLFNIIQSCWKMNSSGIIIILKWGVL